jgi:hypothetical protein
MTRNRQSGLSSSPQVDCIILVMSACGNWLSRQAFTEFTPVMAGNCRWDQSAGMAKLDGESQLPVLASAPVASGRL